MAPSEAAKPSPEVKEVVVDGRFIGRLFKVVPLKLAHHFLGLRASKIADFRGPTDGASGETTGGALDGSVTGRSDNIDIAILVPMA